MKKIVLKSLAIISLFGVILFFSSCASEVPFNSQIVQKYQLTPQMIQGLQFYISKDVNLERAQTSGQKQNTNKTGTLVISSASSSESVTIPKGTEGVCLGIINGSELKVSFEKDNSKFLIFGDPHNVGRYTLMAQSWSNGIGTLQYGDKKYKAQPGAATAYLIIQMKKIKKYKKQTHVAGGRKVKN